jgi:cytochrome c oxidase cbb3-type subunit 3
MLNASSTSICIVIPFSDSIALTMTRTILISASLLISATGLAAAQQGGGRAQSPASQRPPQTATPQTYPAEQVLAGQTRFSAQCGFCHGRDTAGGETGPDLTRSQLVAEDVRGDRIGPLLRAGRVDKGMPAFDLSEADLGAIVAFIHDEKTKAESLGGGRRSVDVADLQTGNAEQGRLYFNGAGCTNCHSVSPGGDLAGIASRVQGLQLLQRMLYPSVRSATAAAKVTVSGPVAARDEFSIAMMDSSGARRSWSTKDVKFTVDDPLSAHFDQLGKYTDNDMHNVYAYLMTLRQER